MSQNKPLWTATNEQGEKFFYYAQLGWVSADTGNVVKFDLTGAAAPKTPEGATHVQIHKGAVYYVRKTATDYCLQDDKGEWVCCGGLINGISGTVVRLFDGYVAKRGDIIRVEPSEGWHKQEAHIGPPSVRTAKVEVESRSGETHIQYANNLDWRHCGQATDIMRWRYAR